MLIARGTTARVLALCLASAVIAAGCTAQRDAGDSAPATASSDPKSSPSTTPTTTAPAATTANPVTKPLPTEQWRAIGKAGMRRTGCPMSRTDLRRLEVSYVTFEGRTERGVLVVNRDVAPSLSRIFTRLFEERFPIRSMKPLETFDGDDDANQDADNTSAFNCRRADQINAPQAESPHANGRAIDINPRENPWKELRCRCWQPSAKNVARSPGKGKILKGGLVWRLFEREGWIWQDIDVPDYMHFDTGYPSRPWPSPKD